MSGPDGSDRRCKDDGGGESFARQSPATAWLPLARARKCAFGHMGYTSPAAERPAERMHLTLKKEATSHRRRNLSHAFAGQAVGIKEVAEKAAARRHCALIRGERLGFPGPE